MKKNNLLLFAACSLLTLGGCSSTATTPVEQEAQIRGRLDPATLPDPRTEERTEALSPVLDSVAKEIWPEPNKVK